MAKCVSVFIFGGFLFFCMSEPIFVLSDKNSDLSFQKKKIKLQPENSLAPKDIHKRWLCIQKLKKFCLYIIDSFQLIIPR